MDMITGKKTEQNSEKEALERIEIQLEDIKGELAKAKLVSEELIADINGSHMPYTEKEKLDTKARIVEDYICITAKEMRKMLESIN